MSQPQPLPAPPEPEIDLLSPLEPGALVRVLVCTLSCGLLGFGAGKWALPRYQARAVVRVASLGALGPVMPLDEVQARAQSHAATLEALRAIGATDPDRAAGRYRFETEVAGDQTKAPGDIVSLTVTGPDAATARALMGKRVSELVAAMHRAYAEAQARAAARLAGASAAQSALEKDEANPELARAASFERWAGELSAARHDARRELALSHDAEVIDPPYVVQSNARALLLAALGCFGGVLLGLALTLRPAPPR